MSSSPDSAAASPRPTIFISYASEDREAARRIRDALEIAGLDVWYDENELSGGDAWDQKIRRQIRDCEYFMPVVSANTEARKEGYFRREWRLATERSLDMADDVLFLIPVTIDATSETTARVPDKFLTVQWLRLPGGQATPALHHVVRRILAGDHHALTRAPFARPASKPADTAAEPPPLQSAPPPEPPPAAAPESHPPMPPMPPFPQVPEKGGFFHGVKFMAEVLWWALTAAWMLFCRAPKWLRVLIVVWLVTTLFTFKCNRSPDRPSREPAVQNADTDKARTRKAIKAAAAKIAQAAREGDKDGAAGGLAQLGSKFARDIAVDLKDAEIVGKQLVAVPFAFGVTDEAEVKFLSAVFAPLYGRLALERTDETGLAREPLPMATDEALAALGHRLAADYTLGARLTRAGDNATLSVRLLKTDDRSLAWSGDYPVTGADPAAIAENIASGVLAVVPREN